MVKVCLLIQTGGLVFVILTWLAILALGWLRRGCVGVEGARTARVVIPHVDALAGHVLQVQETLSSVGGNGNRSAIVAEACSPCVIEDTLEVV